METGDVQVPGQSREGPRQPPEARMSQRYVVNDGSSAPAALLTARSWVPLSPASLPPPVPSVHPQALQSSRNRGERPVLTLTIF